MASRSNYVSICSGGGGLDLGVRLADPRTRPVLYVEREVGAAAVLARAIKEGCLEDAPIWSDLSTLDIDRWRGIVDGIVGGFPCQPHSFAGKRRGANDERDLWPLVAAMVYRVQPSWCFFENVPGIMRYYWRRIRPDLQALGYEVEEGLFSAEEVGAPHLRERLFWLAYRDSDGAGERYRCDSVTENPGTLREGRDRQSSQESSANADEGDSGMADSERERHDRGAPDAGEGTERGAIAARAGEDLGDAAGARRQRPGIAIGNHRPHEGQAFPPGPADRAGWVAWLARFPGTEPALRRDADGMAHRTDRLRVLGNGVVPVVAAHAWRTLWTCKQ